MNKLPDYLMKLATAIFVLALSIYASIVVLLAAMPVARELSLQLTLVHWDGYSLLASNVFKILFLLLFAAFGVKTAFAKPKEPQKQ